LVIIYTKIFFTASKITNKCCFIPQISKFVFQVNNLLLQQISWIRFSKPIMTFSGYMFFYAHMMSLIQLHLHVFLSVQAVTKSVCSSSTARVYLHVCQSSRGYSIANSVSNIFIRSGEVYWKSKWFLFYIHSSKIRPPCFSDFLYVIHSPGFWFDIFIFLNFTQCDWLELSKICLFCRNHRSQFWLVKPRG